MTFKRELQGTLCEFSVDQAKKPNLRGSEDPLLQISIHTAPRVFTAKTQVRYLEAVDTSTFS